MTSGMLLPTRPADPSQPFDHLWVHVREAMMLWAARLLPLLLAVVAGLLVTRWWIDRRRHATFAEDAREVAILPPPEVDPAGGQALWANLVGLLRPHWRRLWAGQPHLVFSYTWTDAGLRISLWVPGTIPPGLVERAVEAAWPAASTQVTPATNVVPATAQITAGALRMARPDDYPLKHDHDADPLRALLGAAVGLREGEIGVLQILARPATGRRLWHARQSAAHLRGGTSSSPASRLLDLLTPGPSRPPTHTALTTIHPERGAEVRAILEKASHPRWATSIRYAVATTNPTGQPEDAVHARLRGRAHALASASALFTGHNQLVRRRLRQPVRVLNERRLGRGQLLSVPELAALAHLPTDPAIPGLERAGARVVAPPPNTPRPGAHAKPLGVSDAGIARPVALRVADARHHVHILGSNGAGKSTLIATMVLADVAAGRGAIVIDPKGDLITDLLARLPETVADKTVLFDPDDAGPAPGLNVLHGLDSDLVTDHLVGIFHKIFDKFWGPRTDDVLRAACLTLARHPGTTLADIPRLLGETAYRRRATASVRDPILRGFWTWYDGLSEPHRAFVTGPVMNKLRAFLLRKFVRATVGARTSSFDMNAVLDGGVCLVRLPKGVLGEETTRLLGSFILARAWQATTHRSRIPEGRRKDAGIYIDEAQNFLTLPHGLEDMLAEARAYRVSLVLAHQNMAQLGHDLREAISANARSKVFFTISPEDAHTLHRHVEPNLTDHDLTHLGAYQAAARLVVASRETPAFTLRTTPLPAPTTGRAAKIRAAARAAHGAHQARQPR